MFNHSRFAGLMFACIFGQTFACGGVTAPQTMQPTLSPTAVASTDQGNILQTAIPDTPTLQSTVYLPAIINRSSTTIGNCPMFPLDNIWNTPIDKAPVDPRSDAYILALGADLPLHPFFGEGTWRGAPIGLPYVVVPGSQPLVPISFTYYRDSDPGPYPIPPNPPIEATVDRHILVLNKGNCILYEVYKAVQNADGSWTAGSGAMFNLRSNSLRPYGWTSADAAGLPILPGLVRFDEVGAKGEGEIRHALRFAGGGTYGIVWPARHTGRDGGNPNYPPMGQRFRLKASVDISGYSPQVQVILRALKKYGMFIADIGANWNLDGVPDQRWMDNSTLVNELHQISGSDFEAVDESGLMIDPNSGQALQK